MGNKKLRKQKISRVELRKLKRKISSSIPRSKGAFTKKCTGEQQQLAAPSSAAEETADELVEGVPPTLDLEVEEPPTTEPAVHRPDAARQQATAQPEEAVEAPQPLTRLRQRSTPPLPTRKRGKDLRSAVVADDKQRLAGLVRGQPVLYNPEYAHHGERAHTHYAWAYISRRMSRTESECISMWKRLKDRYRAAVTRQKRSAEQGLRVKPSQYDNYMAFMKPHLYMWKKITVADEAPPAHAPERTPRPPRPPSPPRPPRPARPPRNTLVELFRNLGETVKAFPEDMKSRVKSEVLKVVQDARELVLKNNSVEQLFVVEEVEDIKEEPQEEVQQT